MSNWRSIVRSEAEQAVEHFGIPANENAVDALASDSLFQELAVAHHSADLAHDVTISLDADDSEDMMSADVEEAATDLLGLLRDRAAVVLLSEAVDGLDGRQGGEQP